MRLIVAWLGLWIVAGCSGVARTETPVAAACGATLPNGDTPPGENPGPTWYGNGRLYTALWPNGEIRADPSFVEADGSIGMKFPWWRAAGVGAAGDLEITGREIRNGASITAHIPDGYGQGFQASGITFPTEGCYEITGQSGEARLTFVTKVTKVAAAAASPY
jgi:hypothetical protein